MKYCAYCGKELKEGADICLHCGKLMTNLNSGKPKIPGKGQATASLVLGIVAIVWSLFMLIGLPQGIETLTVEMYYNSGSAYVIGYFIGFTLFSLTPGIIGLCQGINGNKKYKSNKAIAGIILNGLSLLSCLYVLIRFLAII